MRNQKGFAPLILLLIAIVFIAGAGFVYIKTHNAQSQNRVSQQPSNSAQPTATPTILPKNDTIAPQTYKNHYGEYQIKLPEKWNAVECPGEGGPGGCALLTTANTNDEKNPVWTGAITVNASIPDNKTASKSFNFNIPALGNGLNAIFEKSSDKSTASFFNRGVLYTFEADYKEGSKLGFNSDSLDQILKTTAASITFLNEPSSCKDSALMSLIDFPTNFALYNYHDSDSTDPVYSYWPYTNKRDDSKYLQDDASRNSKRGFMVLYVKDGNSFNDSSSFSNSVTSIHPNQNGGGFDETGTGLYHFNCIDTQEDGPGNDMPYHISENDTDQFGIHLYGNASNPQTLWGTAKWNLNLLKSVRNKVYIKRGNLWQGYKATDYFATMPTAYGGKPAIYLYPKTTTNIKVEIHPQGQLLKTDSLYDSKMFGWDIVANPDGLINNKVDSLYYEAAIPIKTPTNGYVVTYNDLFSFSKQYVQELGLNENESNAFIQFWRQKLPPALYYMVTNLDQDTINSIYPLQITPKPDTILRIELYFKPLATRIPLLLPRHVNPPARTGFTAVEWGGIMDIYK